MTATMPTRTADYHLYGPVLSFHVIGDPVGQGNIRHLGKGRPAVHQNADRLLPWRQIIAATAHNEKARAGGFGPGFPLTGPVGLALHFTVRKPAGAPRTRRTYPTKRPDLSHFVRAVEDALVAAGVLADDAQVVHEMATKAYPNEIVQSLDVPGVIVRVYTVGEGKS